MTDPKTAANAAIIAASQLVSNAGKTGMRDSAELCLTDARGCFSRGNFPAARRRALESLAYSVGVFDPNYLAIAAA